MSIRSHHLLQAAFNDWKSDALTVVVSHLVAEASSKGGI